MVVWYPSASHKFCSAGLTVDGTEIFETQRIQLLIIVSTYSHCIAKLLLIIRLHVIMLPNWKHLYFRFHE